MTEGKLNSDSPFLRNSCQALEFVAVLVGSSSITPHSPSSKLLHAESFCKVQNQISNTRFGYFLFCMRITPSPDMIFFLEILTKVTYRIISKQCHCIDWHRQNFMEHFVSLYRYIQGYKNKTIIKICFNFKKP